MVTENENMQNGKEPNNFGLPEGYFQKSAAALMNKIEWQDEHQEYKRLLELKNKKPFAVPPAYFETNACKIELLDYPQLRSLNRQGHAFKVPVNYFDEAALLELSKVIGEDEPFFIPAPVKNPFGVGHTYFKESEAQLKTLLTTDKKTARVIPLLSIRRVAAVAALLLIAFGFWMYGFYFNVTDTKDCGTIACIDKTELLKAKAIESLETDELYELVNSQKLEDKLNNNVPGKTQIKDSSAESDEWAVDDLPDGI